MSENPFQVESNSTSEALTKPSASADYCTMSVAETVSQLRTDAQRGLSSTLDIEERRAQYGANELSGEEDESLLMKFVSCFYSDPLILLLIASAAVSFLMGNIDDAVSITLAITIVVTVGFVQEYRSEKSLEALNKLVPAECHLVRNGTTSTVLAATLVPGDVVTFGVGDRIPADIRITQAVELAIDESNLTGETEPVHKSSHELSQPGTVSQRECIAFMGTLVRDGHGQGIVIGTGHDTAFGSVFEMMNSIEKPKTPLQHAMDKLGKDLSMASFGVIGVIGLIGVLQGRSWLEMFQISVSLAVAAIPEGLPIIVTVTLALGVLRMANRKAIVRRLPSVETLGSVNVICSDKTGTLTMNHQKVAAMWTLAMGETSLKVDKNMQQYMTEDVKKTLEIGNICNNAKYSNENGKFVGNPTDIAILEALPKFGLADVRQPNERDQEMAFSSKRKFMAVRVGKTTYVKGAFEKILAKSTSYVTSSGKTESLSQKQRESIDKASKELASQGLRVLAFGTTTESWDKNTDPESIVFAGLVAMLDPPRPSVRAAIEQLMQGGVHVIMITGDSENTAVSIARQIGIPVVNENSVLTGDKLETMNEDQLAAVIDHVNIFARATPEHKLNIVRALQKRGDIVAMTGDGVNDAPALKLADIGVSMGKMGTDVAKEASDMVLTDDDFSTILSAIEEGKGIFNNIQNFLTFQLSTSVAALSLIAISTMFGMPNPLNAMQILWINILMDGPPAQSLGVEPVDHEVMKKPPRRRADKILTTAVFQRLFLSAAFILAGTLFVFTREMQDGVVTARDTTMAFTCFVLFDMFNGVACRHPTKSIFEIGLFTNKMFNFAVGGSILGQLCAIYIPFFQSVFQTEALSLGDLGFLTLISSTVLIADEVRKYMTKEKRDVHSYV